MGVVRAQEGAVIAAVDVVVRGEERSVIVSVAAAAGIQGVVLVVRQVVVERTLAQLVGPAVAASLRLDEARVPGLVGELDVDLEIGVERLPDGIRLDAGVRSDAVAAVGEQVRQVGEVAGRYIGRDVDIHILAGLVGQRHLDLPRHAGKGVALETPVSTPVPLLNV